MALVGIVAPCGSSSASVLPRSAGWSRRPVGCPVMQALLLHFGGEHFTIEAETWGSGRQTSWPHSLCPAACQARGAFSWAERHAAPPRSETPGKKRRGSMMLPLQRGLAHLRGAGLQRQALQDPQDLVQQVGDAGETRDRKSVV